MSTTSVGFVPAERSSSVKTAALWKSAGEASPVKGISEAGTNIKIWHGQKQQVGHLGSAQDDFNLVGEVTEPEQIASLQYQLNDQPFIDLTLGRGRFGDRRLGAGGHFNADIPITSLNPGRNIIVLRAADKCGRSQTKTVTLEKLDGVCELPQHIRWKDVADPQQVGQYVDGHWMLDEQGLRTKHSAYDRVFLVGEKRWQDYEVTVPVTINRVDRQTSPKSGGNGVGIILRFAGHVVGGHRNFPAAQPKVGYQPFGAICWLRWKEGQPDSPPQKQFYAGYSDNHVDLGKRPIKIGRTYFFKARCETLTQLPTRSSSRKKQFVMQETEYATWEAGHRVKVPVDHDQEPGVTRYSFKVWPARKREPKRWDWRVTQASVNSLRSGGVALVAHHVDATFGDVGVVPIGESVSPN